MSRAGPCDRYVPIKDYAAIGDCQTAALVSREGSIDWYCPGRFDAPAVFSRLLDFDRGGYFAIHPDQPFHCSRGYLEDTNILRTEFRKGESCVAVTDFMPVFKQAAGGKGADVGTEQRIVRLVEGISGSMDLKVEIRPVFNYGLDRTATSTSHGNLVARLGNASFVARLPGIKLERAPKHSVWEADLRVKAGDRAWLVTSWSAGEPAGERTVDSQCERWLEETRRYWSTWAARCSYRGPYRQAVVRSALVLKMLTYEPTGAVIAAPTASLPEGIGGARNWDYRFSWVRDSSLIIYALMNIGYAREAADYFEWLRRTHAKSPRLQILYALDGSPDVPERTLEGLEGYRCSAPVRVGNAAARQTQIDIYGEVMMAAHLYFTSDRFGRGTATSRKRRKIGEDWPLFKWLVGEAASHWRDADKGIWEVRGPRRQFLHSRLMCWVALDRGIRLAERYSLPAPMEEWESVRDSIRKAILSEGYSARLKSFVQALGGSSLDASCLLIPRTGFLPATDEKVTTTIEAVERELVKGGLVYRYLSDDGLPGGEAAFVTCNFWLADALALSGRTDRASEVFEAAIGMANDVGLFSEEIEPETGEFCGNFPQGYSHMALINAAIDMSKAAKHGPETRRQNESQRARKAGAAASQG